MMMNQQITNRQNAPTDCRSTMKQLRALDFAIQETVLYLDAYPDSREALDYYHQLLQQRKSTLAAYEKNCGPVTMYGNTSEKAWDWVKTPWPWELDAN